MKKRRQEKTKQSPFQTLSAVEWIGLVDDAAEGRRLRQFKRHFAAIKRGQNTPLYDGYNPNFLVEVSNRARARGHQDYLDALALALIEADIVK